MAIEEEMMAANTAPAPEAQGQAPAQGPSEGQPMSPDEESDLNIAVMLAEKMIDEGGIEVIEEAVKTSRDPGQVVGQFLMQMVIQMSEQMPREMALSPRIYFAHGGWVEQISDYLQEEYGIDQRTMDRAEMFIGSQAEQMAQGQAQQKLQQADPTQTPMPGGAAAPAGAPPIPMGVA